MPEVQKNVSLKKFNTFGINAKASSFCEVRNVEEIQNLLRQPEFNQPHLWLGGGSNMLLTSDFNGLVIRLNLLGKEIVEESEQSAVVAAAAGENWHELVLYTLQHNLGGLENLSLIPGNAGTAPIQNIGAYGIELKDIFHHLEALDLQSGKVVEFYPDQCEFGYRDSIFKKEKGRYIVTRIFLELNKEDHHQVNTSYGAIERELERINRSVSIHSISEAVINIRKSKLPDPAEIGNSGSFFKNPVVDEKKYQELKKEFEDLVGFKLDDGNYKLAAGWLIEKTGWKGYRKGDAGVHKNQALVLVNYGNASGGEIYGLAQQIQASVFSTFGVNLEAEVNIIGTSG